MTEAFSVAHWPPWWAIIRSITVDDRPEYVIVAEFGEDLPGDPEVAAREMCARLNGEHNAAVVALAEAQD